MNGGFDTQPGQQNQKQIMGLSIQGDHIKSILIVNADKSYFFCSKHSAPLAFLFYIYHEIPQQWHIEQCNGLKFFLPIRVVHPLKMIWQKCLGHLVSASLSFYQSYKQFFRMILEKKCHCFKSCIRYTPVMIRLIHCSSALDQVQISKTHFFLISILRKK